MCITSMQRFGRFFDLDGMHYTDLQNLSTSKFQRLVGAGKDTFRKMAEVVEERLSQRPDKRGRPCLLGVPDQLLVMLMYYREYRCFLHIGAAFGISEAQCWRTVRRIEDYLMESSLFHLPGKKTLCGGANKWGVVVVDVGESPIQRPKKKQRPCYSGKKKRHTLKTQLIVDKKSKKIICVAVSKGSAHDLKVFRQSRTGIHAGTQVLADSGYQGIQELHPNCTLPIKGSKKKPLGKPEKAHNRQVGSRRAMVEHTIRKLKIFKVLAETYRNRRKRFGLRVSLIAAIYNYQLL